MQNNSELHNEWMTKLLNLSVDIASKNLLFEPYKKYGRYLDAFLKINNLPAVEGGEYIAMWEGIKKSVDAVVESSDDAKRVSGAILWRFIKATHPEKEPKKNKEANPEQYRTERRFQRNMFELLGHFDLDMYAKDKINALDYLEYKFSADQYRRVYKKLGQYNFGEDAHNFDFEKTQTIKIFYELLEQSRKTTGKDKIISAQSFLENVARNALVLQSAKTTDQYGNEMRITPEARQEMFKAMKKSKVEFSSECMDYFEGKDKSPNALSYIQIVMNKMDKAQSFEQRKKVAAQNFANVNSLLLQERNVSDALLINYASYLSECASLNSDNNAIKADLLGNLVDKHLETKNNIKKRESLFPEYEKEIKSNKGIVLKIAEVYSASFTCSHLEASEFNPYFHNSMTEMFENIVTAQDYQKSDVEQLCGVLKNNKDPEMQRMAKKIMMQYTSKGGGNSGNTGHSF